MKAREARKRRDASTTPTTKAFARRCCGRTTSSSMPRRRVEIASIVDEQTSQSVLDIVEIHPGRQSRHRTAEGVHTLRRPTASAAVRRANSGLDSAREELSMRTQSRLTSTAAAETRNAL